MEIYVKYGKGMEGPDFLSKNQKEVDKLLPFLFKIIRKKLGRTKKLGLLSSHIT